MSARIRKVDCGQDEVVAWIDWLQAVILPGDSARPIGDDHWWLAYSGRSPVAFASLAITHCGSAYLSRVGVLPGARGCGLQKRLIRARVNYARRLGVRWVITDTTANPASANSLIAEGFKVFDPASPWAFKHSTYWFKPIN